MLERVWRAGSGGVRRGGGGGWGDEDGWVTRKTERGSV